MWFRLCVLLVSVLRVVRSDATTTQDDAAAKESPPYINVILCPMLKEPWECFKQESGRVLSLLDISYRIKWNEFKDEANNEITAQMQARGFSATNKIKEKTSSIFDKIEDGVIEIKDFAISTANELLGREEESDYELIDDNEDFEIEGEDKKKGQHGGGGHGGGGGGHGGGGHGGGGHGNKIKKKKKKPQGALQDIEQHDDLEELEWTAELLEGLGDGHEGGGHGGNHGIKFPKKHGRSLGVTRGKKKKKTRKAIMKLVLIGSVIKGKIELLLKLLSAHLQIKFFAIALVGLLINLARFWLDVKRGHTPQKVIYYEHAHHQHHYDEHDDWDQGGGGGYWRRSVSGENQGSEGLDEDTHYSKISDDYPSSYLKELPNRMAYQGQYPRIRAQ